MDYAAPSSPSLAHIDFGALDTFRFADGGGFPKSYSEFVRTAGWARTFGLWLIYPPVLTGFADGRGRALRLTEQFRAIFRDGEEEDFDWMIAPDGNWLLAAQLQVFGWSENGDVVLWDTAQRGANGEFPVWESRGMNTLHLLGANLDEALPGLSERAGNQSIEPLGASKL